MNIEWIPFSPDQLAAAASSHLPLHTYTHLPKMSQDIPDVIFNLTIEWIPFSSCTLIVVSACPFYFKTVMLKIKMFNRAHLHAALGNCIGFKRIEELARFFFPESRHTKRKPWLNDSRYTKRKPWIDRKPNRQLRPRHWPMLCQQRTQHTSECLEAAAVGL